MELALNKFNTTTLSGRWTVKDLYEWRVVALISVAGKIIASEIAAPKMFHEDITGKSSDNNPYQEPSNINNIPPELRK